MGAAKWGGQLRIWLWDAIRQGVEQGIGSSWAAWVRQGSAHRFVFHQLHLQACDLGSESTDLLAGLVLVYYHLVFDVSSPVGIFECVKRLHEVPIRGAHTGDHDGLAKSPTRLGEDEGQSQKYCSTARFCFNLTLLLATEPGMWDPGPPG